MTYSLLDNTSGQINNVAGATIGSSSATGDQWIIGKQSGNNKLVGGSGNDIVEAMGSSNLLTGGAGKDVFELFYNPEGFQVITDFSSNDIIVLKNLGYVNGTSTEISHLANYITSFSSQISNMAYGDIAYIPYTGYSIASINSNASLGAGGRVGTATQLIIKDGIYNPFIILENVDIGSNLRFTNHGGYVMPNGLTEDTFLYLYSGAAAIANNTWVGNTIEANITENTFGSAGLPSTGVTYHWSAGGSNTTTTTSKYLVVPASLFGQQLSVYATYTDAYGNAETTATSTLSNTINGVFDTAANVSLYIDAIQAYHSTISNALNTTGSFQILDGANTATQFSVHQLTSDADALALVVGHHYLAAVKDSAQNIGANLSTVLSNIGNLSSISFTDSASVVLHNSDAANLSSAFTAGNDFHTHAHTEMLYNLDSSGILYIKFSGESLGTLSAGTSVLFNDLLGTTASLANNSTTPFFHSSGGINGLTLPDLFTGPSSLGLTYQLIETAQNAVVTGSSDSEFIKVANANSIGKAVNGNGGNDVIDGGVGSTFVTGGANHNTTFFLDGRAPGTSWSTITDFRAGVDKATIWGFVKGVSSVDTSFTNYNNEGAAGYQGLTLHFKNLLPDGQTAGSNPNLNSITFTGHTLAELGASSLADLNNQINNGTNAHILVGSTQDSLGTHSYLYFH